MAVGDEIGKIKKELEKERSDDAESKPDSPFGPKLGEMAEKMGSSAQGQESQSPDALKKQISDIVRKKVDSSFSDIKDNLKGLEKISDLEGKINVITEKLNSQILNPPAQAKPSMGGSSIAKELASFGEEVDFQTELYELRKSMTGIAKALDTLSKKTDYRVSVLEDRARILDRVPDIEESIQDMRQKLGPENVQKLRKLIFSSDEIVDEVIPDLVTKKMRSKLDPALHEVREMQQGMLDLGSKIGSLREEVLNLEKLREGIQELHASKENIYKELGDSEAKLNERMDIVKEAVRKKIESVSEKLMHEMSELRKAQSDSIKKGIKDAYLDLNEPRLSDIEKKLLMTDEKFRQLMKVDSELDGKISSIQAPDNVRKWVDSRVGRIEKGLASEVSGLKKKSLDISAEIARQADALRTFHVAMKDVPKRIDHQESMIGKLLDTKDFFAGRAEGMAADIKSLNERLAIQNSGLKGLEERVAGQDSRFNDMLHSQRDYLTSARDELNKQMSREMAGIRKDIENKTRDMAKSSLAEFKSEMKKVAGTDEEVRSLRKAHDTVTSRLQKDLSDLQADLKQAIPEIGLSKERLASLEHAIKELDKGLSESHSYHKTSGSVLRAELMKYVDSSLKGLARELDEKRKLDARASLEEVRQETGRIDSLEKDLSNLSSSLSVLKALSEKAASLDDHGQRLSTRLDELSRRQETSLTTLSQDLAKRLEKATASLRTELSARQAQDTKAQVSQLREELKRMSSLEEAMSAGEKRLDRMAEELSSMSGPVTDLKALTRRVNELEDIVKATDKRIDAGEDRFIGQSSDLSARLEGVSKALDELKISQKELAKRVSQDNQMMQVSLRHAIRDREGLEKEMASQREKMGDLIRELRSA